MYTTLLKPQQTLHFTKRFVKTTAPLLKLKRIDSKFPTIS